jgi:hypothetical protein
MGLGAIPTNGTICMVVIGKLHWWFVFATYCVHFAVQAQFSTVESL